MTRPAARSRRLPMRGVALAVAVVAMLAIVVPAGLLEGRLHPARVPVRDDPSRHGLSFEPVEFPSLHDAVTLRGWYLRAPVPTGRAVVIAPGIDANREMNGISLALAPALLDAGFAVLAFDLRAEGESGGDTIAFGWTERWDVLGAVAEARRRGADRVAVLGFSLGGAASILAAAESPAIDALIVDSAFARLDQTLRRELEGFYRLPAPVATYGLMLYGALSGTDPARVAPVERIDAVRPRPILLIHGTADRTVPPADCQALAVAASASEGCWLVPSAGHTEAYRRDPDGYRARLLSFLEAALPRSVARTP